MRISELFRRLSYGELSNLSLSNNGSGEIKEEKHPQLIQHTNEALLRLYSRYILLEKEVIIEQVENLRNYPLRLQYAVSSGSNEEHHFIKDNWTYPFHGDVIRILAVYDSCGQLPLNDEGKCDSLFLPQPDMLQVPVPVTGQPLHIIYQARHPKLRDTVAEGRPDSLLAQDIDIPFFLEGALQAYVAHKVYGNMNTQENILNSQKYKAQYEEICAGVDQQDLLNQSYSTTRYKLEMRGFV